LVKIKNLIKMKKIINISFFCLLVLLTLISCRERKSGNCHYNIYILNKSDKTIYSSFSRNFPDTSLNGVDIVLESDVKAIPNDSIAIGASSGWGGCWEKNLNSEEPLPMKRVMVFIYDEKTIKTIFWDTIKAKKLYLKRYDLKLEDLQNSNWRISYP
jgi:hypothetical protein